MPPGGYGTMKRTGFVGHACAATGEGTASAANANTSVAIAPRRVNVLVVIEHSSRAGTANGIVALYR